MTTDLKQKPTALHEGALETLREWIMEGRLKPGDPLIDSELCKSFNISRTPLREAIKLLEAEGLVTLRRNRSAVVRQMDVQEIDDLFELISTLEGLALTLAHRRMRPAQHKRLGQMHETMIEHYHAGRLRPCFQADYAIHNFIVAQSGNAVLQATHEGLMARARRGRYHALFDTERWHSAMQEHEAVMTTLHTGDLDAARKLLEEHVRHTGEVLRQRLLQHSVSPSQLGSNKGET